ncbi:hypothetical protein [Paraburkholderia terricola]|uniref:hypothetical protein n=1 Tax=Paraburkholderia terricola TaxID=169427 RepID=UPI003ECC458C
MTTQDRDLLDQAVRSAEENPEDPWEEILNLAMHDPCVRQAVDMVRCRGMSVIDAALLLALAQSKRVAILQDELVKARMLAPFPAMIQASWVTDKTA